MDGLKLADINVAKVVRKTNRSDDKPGIVVIPFATMEHKKGVFKAKRVLKNSTKYSRVYIENDLSLQQRIKNNNNCTLLKALGRENDFMIKTGRVVNGQRANNYPRSRTDRNDPDYSDGRKSYESNSRRGRGSWLAETPLVRQSVVDIEGYTWCGHNRKHIHVRARTGSGGVGVLVRNDVLVNYNVDKVRDSVDEILWIRFFGKKKNNPDSSF
ncbi:Hypothetical predicted protein [Mytilus galloprovincialis]|uniref:Uncharacterized protein n=1 Tax=Mytilus galloprovincialis TaxID=29158 RepID=A0A8B6D146_MYTGA|nr:Hypothetical predicted protein [Mytilus galloprovincialis]